MAKEKISFIIRAKNGYNSACRCINSVKRQSVPKYDLLVCVYKKSELEQLKKEYPDVKFKYVKKDKAFVEKFNEFARASKSKYCVMLDGDSLIAPDAVETILEHNSDTLIFNIAKINEEGRFRGYYANKTLENEVNYIKRIQSVWAVAVKPDMIRDKDISLKGMDYPNQALYLLMCMSLAKEVKFTLKCLIYKWTVIGDKEITAEFFEENKDDISRAIKAFADSGRNKAKAQVIRIFMMNEIEESFDLPVIQRLKKVWSLVKMIWF